MRELREVRFIFETCETCVIPAEFIGRFVLSNIKDVTFGIATDFNIAQRANVIAMEIFIAEKISKSFTRLRTKRDIACIQFVDIAGETKSYLTNFCGNNINRYQDNRVSACGNLYIVISKNDTVSDFFEKRDIDNPIEVAIRKQDWQIGKKRERWHVLSEHSLPELNRWIYLRETKGQEIVAKRIEDKYGWRFVFKYPGKAIHFPKQWKYMTMD